MQAEKGEAYMTPMPIKEDNTTENWHDSLSIGLRCSVSRTLLIYYIYIHTHGASGFCNWFLELQSFSTSLIRLESLTNQNLPSMISARGSSFTRDISTISRQIRKHDLQSGFIWCQRLCFGVSVEPCIRYLRNTFMLFCSLKEESCASEMSFSARNRIRINFHW